MSRKATDWAWDQLIKPASLKIILLSMADRADEYHQCYPSISRLTRDTSLDKKTVQSGILKLIDKGLVSDTGKKMGPTQRVRVLRLNLDVGFGLNRNPNPNAIPNTSPNPNPILNSNTPALNDPKNGNVTKSGNVPKNGNVPNNGNVPENGTLNDPENGTLNDPENGILNDPENGIQNQSLEPVIESLKDLPSTSPKSAFDFSRWPALPSEQVFKDWLAVRKQKKAKLTQTAINRLAPHLVKAVAAGCSVDAVFELCVSRCWIGFEFDWLMNAGLIARQAVKADWSSSVFDPEDPLI
jgi:hypothetical protein